MNPIPLNDRGQFRYTDLVGYIPEFLQEEPDVVDFLQVMSDYINDAYRNIEDVEEFEFKLCTTSDGIARVTAVLSRLRTMFELASNRGDRVCYLSVPRANVKTNAVFGKASGYTPYYLDIGYTEVVDVIKNISSIDRRVAEMSDGDVVFVNYATMSPVVTRAYYYSRSANALIVEPEYASQDPFTNTDNTGNRMISFLVSDISSISKRYGGEIGGNSYYEILFTARISDVSTESATEKVYFDVDRIDETKDEVYIDYYGMEYVSKGKYHATISFFNTDGWEWKDGYPTGIFYLKETSAAKLATLNNDSDTMMEMPVDPAARLESDRYALADKVYIDLEKGVCRFITETAFPQQDSGRFYLMDRLNGACVGEFQVAPQEYMEDKFVTMAYPVWMDDLDDKNTKDRLFIMCVPLYFNRGIADMSKSQPRMTWKFLGDGEYVQMDWKNTSATRVRQSSEETVRKLGGPFKADASIIYDNLCRSIYVPNDVMDALTERMPISCDGKLWSGSYTTVQKLRNNLYFNGKLCGLLTISPNCRFDISNPIDAQLYTGFDGSITVDSDGTCIVTPVHDLSNYNIANEKYVAIGSSRGYKWASAIKAIEQVDGTTGQLRFELETIPAPGTYDLVVGTYDMDFGYAARFSDVLKGTDGWIGATCGLYDNDVYTDGVFRLTDGRNTAYVEVGAGSSGSEIMEFVADGRRYEPGMTVYDPYTEMLYTCVAPYTADDSSVQISTSPYFARDNATRHRVPYVSTRNMFMPFYGQVKSMEFGEKVPYSSQESSISRPLYITKVVENRLKYGWEHREFLNYGTAMTMTDRARNGSLEVYSSRRTGSDEVIESRYDMVTATIDRMVRWVVDYPVIKRGTDSRTIIDVDNPVSLLAELEGNNWVVTVSSAGHGLIDGVVLRVAGYPTVDGLSINGYRKITVISGDAFTITIPKSPSEYVGMFRQIPVDSGIMEYIGDYWMNAISVQYHDQDASEYVAVFDLPMVGVHPGDELTLVDMDDDVLVASEPKEYGVVAVDDGADTDRGFRFKCPAALNLEHHFQIRRKIASGDYVQINDDIYLTDAGMWEERDAQSVATPATLYSKQNIANISETNPEFALGDDIRIESIMAEGDDIALVRLKDPVPHFVPENAQIIEKRTMVRLSKVTPGEYNGWHTITEVISPKAFRMSVRFTAGTGTDGVGLNGGEMIMNEGRWYAFTLHTVALDKISNRVTFSLDNKIVDGELGSVVTSRNHGLRVGDYVVVGDADSIATMDADNVSAALPGMSCFRVKSVPSSSSLTLETISGELVNGSMYVGFSIARGVVLSARMDDLGTLRGEYTRELDSIGGRSYRFLNGDIVVAGRQQNPSEIRAWKVRNDASWTPVRAKRAMKVSELGIHRYYNSEYEYAAEDEDVDVDKYETYSDVDIHEDTGMKYIAGFRTVDRANFIAPALDDMDTTRNANAEYSSGEDFSNVAPRYNMKSGFRGVPAMKYPLAEKIERLCYLRDASVIDYDLIEYLARYLGYDITSLGEDVNDSSIYRTKEEREKAIRETISNLPQYYTLGGTKPGLHMMMATFGIIGEALTLWTDADHPYQDMIYREEVVDRVESGSGGKWVPTPYIDLRVINNAKYPQFTARQEDIERIREQIRVFKPINVVFRDVMLQMFDTGYVTSIAQLAGSSVTGNSGAASTETDELIVDYNDPILNNCAF